MSENADLNIAEIPYESGAIHYRYSRVLSEDRTKWIRHGLFVEYDESGSIITEGNYEFGVEHGIWRDYHPNGQLAAEGNYDRGLEHGVWRFWNEAGVEEHATDYVHGEEHATDYVHGEERA